MTHVNYMRVLSKGFCDDCGHWGYDIDFEKYEILEISEGQFELSRRYVCPECESENTFKSSEL